MSLSVEGVVFPSQTGYSMMFGETIRSSEMEKKRVHFILAVFVCNVVCEHYSVNVELIDQLNHTYL